MRSLLNSPLADLGSEETLSRLRDLHPSPQEPISSIPASHLPPPPEITEAAVLRATRSLNPSSAAVPDRLSTRLLRHIANTSIAPQAGVTGLSALTNLVRRLSRGNLPSKTLPLFTAATLLPIQPKPGKICPIAIGQSFRRLVTKVLLGPALTESREYLSPEQMANGIRAGMDAIVHDTRMRVTRHGHKQDYVLLSIDARNAFNTFSRKQLLDVLPSRAPSLAPFINMVYGRAPPPLIIPRPATSSPTTTPHILYSREGTQQGDPASMLLFSLCLQPLIRKISQECDLDLHRWYADDGILVGRLPEVCKAFRLLRDYGPSYHFHLNPSKTTAFWPTPSSTAANALRSILPINISSSPGITLLGAPIGSDSFVNDTFRHKLAECSALLSALHDLPDAALAFHLHRLCASACRVLHLFRLIPPSLSLPHAERFDKQQMDGYASLNQVLLTSLSTKQVFLPFRLGGHGFTSLSATAHAVYAASLIESSTLRHTEHSPAFYQRCARRALHVVVSSLLPSFRPPQYCNSTSSLGPFEPERIAMRPERPHNYLFQAIHASSAADFWHDEPNDSPIPFSLHSVESLRLCIRRNSLRHPCSSPFLTAHPSIQDRISKAVWSIMLRRHLDLPVYDDTLPLVCSHCHRPMDARGDHSTHCKTGFGVVHRHHYVRNLFADHVFRPAGLACQLEVPLLVPGSNLRPADVLVLSSPSGHSPTGNPRHVAYDITIRSPFSSNTQHLAARSLGGAAEAAHSHKLSTFHNSLRRAFTIPSDAAVPNLPWTFAPLAFDTYAVPSKFTSEVLRVHAERISLRCASPASTILHRLRQRLSFTIWSCIATAISARSPVQLDTSLPIPI